MTNRFNKGKAVMTNRFKNKRTMYIVSFIIPVLVMLFAYLNAGIFTNSSILVNDLYTQYINFLSYFRNSVFQEGIFYSFAKDMGDNFFGIFSYYLASPLNFIVFIFPPENIEYAVSLIMLLRFGLYSVSFLWFLSKQGGKLDFTGVAFSVLYALSSFIALLSYHILWADAFILLPIILAGQQDILKGKKATLFIVSFTVLLLSNYYMGYMVGIFCILYFIYHCMAYGQRQTILQDLLKLAGSAAISVGLAMCMLLPSFFSLLQGKLAINGEILPDIGYRTFNIFSIIPKLFVGGYDSVGNISAPFIYCGGAAGLLVAGYFFLNNKTKREKLATGFILCVFAVSLYFTPLYKVWHMFALTNAFPYRFSFVVSFFVIFIGYNTFVSYKSIDYKRYLPFVIALLLVTAILGVWYPLHIRNMKILFTTVTGLFVIGAMVLAKKTSRGKILYLAAVVCIVDISLNATILTRENYNALGAMPKDSFKSNYISAKSDLEQMDKEGFYRVIFTGDTSLTNHSLKMGYNNYYYSFTSLPNMEAEQAKQNTIHKARYEDIARAVFGVRYSISENSTTEYSDGYFPLIYTGASGGANLKKGEEAGLFLSDYIQEAVGVATVQDDTLNKEALKQACTVATANGIENLYQKGNKIKGKLTAKNEDSYGYTSIIYDEAWQIKVNGQRVKPQRLLENFICFKLPKGESNLEMTYYPKGIFTGLGVTVATLLSVAATAAVKKIRIGYGKAQKK